MRTFLIIVCVVACVTSLRIQRTTVTKATKKRHIQAITSSSLFLNSSVDDLKRDIVKKQQNLGRQTWDYLDVVKQKLRKNNDDYIERNHLKHSLFI